MENAHEYRCMIHFLEEKVFVFIRKKPLKHMKFKGNMIEELIPGYSAEVEWDVLSVPSFGI